MNATLDQFLVIKKKNEIIQLKMPEINEIQAFPKNIEHLYIPPIKCQGIKSKLVKFILTNIKWSGKGKWFEPFMGSGVVSFNATPNHAILSDINPYLINFYTDIQTKKINPNNVREFLELHGNKLSTTGDSTDSYYYEMRDKFNETHESLYFLFLNRAGFNGLMRFNSKGQYNTPVGRKPQRFSKSYITKIVNQINWVQKLITTHDYQFKCCSWKKALEEVTESDFVYFDPPYFGRHTTYFDNWGEEENLALANFTKTAKCGWAISLWFKNKHRENTFIKEHWADQVIRTNEHYYFIGSKEDLRTSMMEALIIKKENATEKSSKINNQYSNYRT